MKVTIPEQPLNSWWEQIHVYSLPGVYKYLKIDAALFSSRGCFTADGYAVVDILPSPTVEGPLLPPYTSSQMNGLLSCGSGLPHPLPGGLLSPGPRVAIGKMFHIGDSDSASECGSDVHSESNFQVGCTELFIRILKINDNFKYLCRITFQYPIILLSTELMSWCVCVQYYEINGATG